MSVESFDPSAGLASIGPEVVQALLALADSLSLNTDDPVLELGADDVSRFAPLAVSSAWVKDLADAPASQLVALIRLLTLGEMAYGSWQAGDKSPVIGLAKVLKKNGDFDLELSQWVKRHTTNRFLPHGSLMDRL